MRLLRMRCGGNGGGNKTEEGTRAESSEHRIKKKPLRYGGEEMGAGGHKSPQVKTHDNENNVPRDTKQAQKAAAGPSVTAPGEEKTG